MKRTAVRLVERYIFKRRIILGYDAPGPQGDFEVARFEPHDDIRALEFSLVEDRFADFLSRRRVSDGHHKWVLFAALSRGRVVGFSSLHIGSRSAWLDSLPTKVGSARESGTFVSEVFRGAGVRAALLNAQLRYCLERSLKMWAVIERTNGSSFRSSVHFGGAVICSNYLVKMLGYNVLSVLVAPLRVYPMPRIREKFSS